MPATALLTALAILLPTAASIPPAPKSVVGNCRVQLEGRRIEKLTLACDNGSSIEFTRPKETVSLPAGRYRVERVVVQGGYSHFSRSSNYDDDSAWFTVAPAKPGKLQVGAPLRPRVSVRPGGMYLNLGCSLIDAAGRRYGGPRTNPPPTFTVYKDGQPIGSGTFEYG